MASKMFCDKCGKEISGQKDGGYYVATFLKNGSASYSGTRVYDLCMKCADELLNGIERKR